MQKVLTIIFLIVEQYIFHWEVEFL